MSEQQESTPNWAVEIIKSIERLDAKISVTEQRHADFGDWTSRNIKDFELRLRILEQFRWLLVGIALASGGVGAVIAKLVGA